MSSHPRVAQACSGLEASPDDSSHERCGGERVTPAPKPQCERDQEAGQKHSEEENLIASQVGLLEFPHRGQT